MPSNSYALPTQCPKQHYEVGFIVTHSVDEQTEVKKKRELSLVPLLVSGRAEVLTVV